MPKFCGNCGTKHEDNAIRCMNCGAEFPDTVQFAQQAQQQYNQQQSQPDSSQNGQQQYAPDYGAQSQQSDESQPQSALPVYQAVPVQDPGKKKKIIAVASLGTLAAALIVTAVILISSLGGYDSLVSKFEKAYTDYDYEKVVDMYSETTLYAYDYDTELISNQTANKMESVLSYFDAHVGHDYKIKFETVDDYEMEKTQFENFKNGLSFFDENSDDYIGSARVVELNMTAKQGGREVTKRVKLILTKDKGSWKIAQFYNY